MSSGHDEGPVYYREVQKNAYLKRIPNDLNTSKLRPLGHKKPPLKAMWTQLCVHNGRTPYLEQYPAPEATLAHRPAWRACLRAARHVTASVKPHLGDEYDFLVDTDHGPVRMLAPDWDSMQDWVSILRTKLHELRIVSRGENVYGAPPAAPVPRAAARDPTSPLPPTPPVPPDRVPGIDLTPITRPTIDTSSENTRETNPQSSTQNPTPNPTQNTTQTTQETPQPTTQQQTNQSPTTTTNPEPLISSTFSQNFSSLPTMSQENVDISNWDVPSDTPSTSKEKLEPKKSVAKICGQNICLDDSIFKRNVTNVTDSDEEFFAEIDRLNDSDSDVEYRQTVVVNNGVTSNVEAEQSTPQRTNITVIQVSNKGPPHTAIPVLGPETDVFDFEFKQKVTVNPQQNGNGTEFINIVHTESGNATESYGTVFENSDSDYGHISLTTTVNLTGREVKENSDGIYERLCMASTSNRNGSPLPVRNIKAMDKVRKSSLPNLDVAESAYECLFPSSNSSQTNGVSSLVVAPVVQPNGRTDRNVTEISRISVVNTGGDVSVNSVSSVRVLRSNVERSHSQNACDSAPRQRETAVRRVQNHSPKRDVKTERTEQSQPKPIWRRGLTELSLLSRLRGIGQTKRHESPTRHDSEADRGVTSPVKVVHRSRPAGRVDSSRRRSNSLTNSQSPSIPHPLGLVPLRARQAAALRAEQRRGACVAASVPAGDVPLVCDYERQVWVARWGPSGYRCGGRPGDRLAAVAASTPASAAHARHLAKNAHGPSVDILFHRVPLGKIYVINKKDNESLGIKLDSECTLVSVAAGSHAARAGLPPPGRWAVTEINQRAINLLKGGEEEMNRLAMHGSEVSILIQPAALVKKIRAAIKATKPLLALR